MKILVKLFEPDCKFEFIKKGEWIDLKAAHSISVDYTLYKEKYGRQVDIVDYAIALGVGMKLPEGFEAIVAPRSSTYKNYGIIMANSIGVIDSSYSGPHDQWRFPALFFRKTTINKGDRICQFRIQPSQKASVWTKLKWLFTRKIEFIFVDNYSGVDRDGFGSTGK